MSIVDDQLDPGLAPMHASCNRRHSPELPCWVGRLIPRYLGLVLDQYGDACCHCGKAGANSVEHVRPRSRWGDDSIGNLRPAHLLCNARRGTRPMPGWHPAGPVTHSPAVARALGRGT